MLILLISVGKRILMLNKFPALIYASFIAFYELDVNSLTNGRLEKDFKVYDVLNNLPINYVCVEVFI